jgi:hypothetical protein
MSMYCFVYWLFGGVSIQRFDMIMGAVLYIYESVAPNMKQYVNSYDSAKPS